MARERWNTAYHEAGHAVASYLFGRRFLSLEIDEQEDWSGVTLFYPWKRRDWDQRKAVLDGKARRRLETDLVITWAGPITEAHFRNPGYEDDALRKPASLGAGFDMKKAREVARWVTLSEDEARAFVRWSGMRTRNFVVGNEKFIAMVTF